MQYHQPLFGIGYPTPGQCPPVFPFNVGASDIIGEGEVTAVTFPDGTIQYYFVPVRWNGSDNFGKRWPPFPFSDSYGNSYNGALGAWIITKISNTISPVFSHCYQRTNPNPFPKPYFNYDCNVNVAPGFQLKFHNDCCTSTTDLHYFCPSLWKPISVATTHSASVQVETPAENNYSCHTADGNVPCDSAQCTCSTCTRKEYNNKIIKCKCKKIEKKSSSRMSIDKSKTSSSSCSIYKYKKKKQKSCSSCYDRNRATKTRRKLDNGSDSENNAVKSEIASNFLKQQAKLSNKKKSQIDCCCNAQNIADKTVVTYTDQASSVKEVEGQTQTEGCVNCSCSTLTPSKRVSVSKRRIPKKINDGQLSEKIIGVYDTSSCESNGSSCSCRTS